MFEALPASGVRRDKQSRWLTTSIVTHVALVALAVVATRGALEAPRVAPLDEPVMLFVPRPEAPVVDEAAPSPQLEPPTWKFEHLPRPSHVPSAIPPIDFRTRPFDPRDFAGLVPENRVADDVAPDPNAIYRATAELEGFVPAVLLGQPAPKYPAGLLAAGLTGDVLVEFVIDTIGRVEAGSVRVIESSHRGFEAAALAAVRGARFRPAHVGARPVRQLSQQRIRFVAAH